MCGCVVKCSTGAQVAVACVPVAAAGTHVTGAGGGGSVRLFCGDGVDGVAQGGPAAEQGDGDCCDEGYNG